MSIIQAQEVSFAAEFKGGTVVCMWNTTSMIIMVHFYFFMLPSSMQTFSDGFLFSDRRALFAAKTTSELSVYLWGTWGADYRLISSLNTFFSHLLHLCFLCLSMRAIFDVAILIGMHCL